MKRVKAKIILLITFVILCKFVSSVSATIEEKNCVANETENVELECLFEKE